MRYFLFLLIVIEFSSCSKNNDRIPVNPIIQDSIYLSKLIVFDTTGSVPSDTTHYTFNYDNIKRLTKITCSNYNASTSSMVVRYTFEHFYYNGNDTLPSKVIERWDNSTNQFTLTHTLSHDNNGRLIRDSSSEIVILPNPGSFIYTNKYLYTSNYYIDSSFSYNPPNSSDDTVYQTRDFENKITREIRVNPSYVMHYDAVYDNHPNPLYKLAVKTPYFVNSMYPSFIEYLTPQKKNFLTTITTKYDASGTTITSTKSINYIITYKANGYPLTIRSVSTPSRVNDKYKFIFVYTNL